MGGISAAGVGLVLLLIGFLFIWKDRAPRFVAWIMLFAGGLMTSVVAPYLGGIIGTAVLGVGIVAIAVVGLGIVFYFEAIKGHGMHHIRTPVCAYLLGIALATSGGAAGNVFASLSNQVVTTVHSGSSITG